MLLCMKIVVFTGLPVHAAQVEDQRCCAWFVRTMHHCACSMRKTQRRYMRCMLCCCAFRDACSICCCLTRLGAAENLSAAPSLPQWSTMRLTICAKIEMATLNEYDSYASC